jgi:hypothetical protein
MKFNLYIRIYGTLRGDTGRWQALRMGEPWKWGPWEWRTLGMADPGSGRPWEWGTLGLAYPNHGDSLVYQSEYMVDH